MREEDFATGYLAVGVGLDDVGRWGCSSESPKVCWLRGRSCSGIQIVLEYEVIWGHIDILVVALRKRADTYIAPTIISYLKLKKSR